MKFAIPSKFMCPIYDDTTTYATIENTLVDVSDFSVLEINKQG